MQIQRIKSIKKTEKCVTWYDICNKDSRCFEPNFILDDVIVHNSSLHEVVIKNKFANETENIFSDKMLEKIGYILDETYGIVCLDGETIVMTENGNIPIKDIVEQKMIGLKLPSFNEEKKELQQDEITNVSYSGIKDTIIIFVNNKQLILTEDHLVLTKNGWKETRTLTLEDEIMCIND